MHTPTRTLSTGKQEVAFPRKPKLWPIPGDPAFYELVIRQTYLKRLKRIRQQARHDGLPADLRYKDWFRLLIAYDLSCAYCGMHQSKLDYLLTCDHLVPRSRGGGVTAKNIVPACEHCNTLKDDLTPAEAGLSLRLVSL